MYVCASHASYATRPISPTGRGKKIDLMLVSCDYDSIFYDYPPE